MLFRNSQCDGTATRADEPLSCFTTVSLDTGQYLRWSDPKRTAGSPWSQDCLWRLLGHCTSSLTFCIGGHEEYYLPMAPLRRLYEEGCHDTGSRPRRTSGGPDTTCESRTAAQPMCEFRFSPIISRSRSQPLDEPGPGYCAPGMLCKEQVLSNPVRRQFVSLSSCFISAATNGASWVSEPVRVLSSARCDSSVVTRTFNCWSRRIVHEETVPAIWLRLTSGGFV